MRKSKKTPEKIRVTLDLSPEFHQRLEQLQETVDADSKAQLIREALRLYEYMVHRHLEDDKFIVRKKSGEEETIVIFGPSLVPA